MCGIGGAIGRRGDPTTAGFATACLNLYARRGPDHRERRTLDSADWQIQLAHNRLTILDLSPGGHQPMAGNRGALWITYNGEIYNHRELRTELTRLGHSFASTSDTEVLLAAYLAWGIECLPRLNGMFAFGLVDLGRQQLVLVRDRLGVKPLHYHLAPARLLFGSTATPLAQVVGRVPDLGFLARSARYGLFDDDSARTQFRHISALRPGHALIVPLDGLTLQGKEVRYYSLEDRVRALAPVLADLGAEVALRDCRALLTDAVTLRLAADVPVAVSLSGGLDSATLSALAAECHPGLVGFTFGHPERPETEGPMAARVAAGLGMRIEYVWPAATAMPQLFWECLAAQDAPFLSGSTVAQYAVFQAVRAAGVKVLLGGQGGDETFMGYRKYLAWRLLAAVRARRPVEAVRSASGLALALWAQREQWRTYRQAGRRHFGRGARDSLLAIREEPASPFRPLPGLGLHGRQIADLTTGGLPTLLRYEDRNSMENSVESRLPFLDYRLAEWAIAVPTGLKLRNGYGKWLLRQVVPDRLPPELVTARAKRGFDVASAEWISLGLGVQIRGELQRTWRHIAEYFVPGTTPERQFSDAALTQAPRRFADAVAALWIGRCLA
jgi:asparagine synthase (glutamine-hydrolysing)